jgi:hypothetical protein
MSSAFGVGAPPSNQPADILEEGAIMVKLANPAAGAATKDGAVFVWATASAGNDVQGGFRTAASAGNTFPVANARFNGPADANGVVELIVWKA